MTTADMLKAEPLITQLREQRTPALLIGPPGCGKTMIARRVGEAPLAKGSDLNALETIYRLTGLHPRSRLDAPFRAPHHTVSVRGMIGAPPQGPTWVPTFGEFTLAHEGTLFLDELPEFSSQVLEHVARVIQTQQVEQVIRTAHNQISIPYPARCRVIAAMNPCPCGWFGMPSKRCSCSTDSIARYIRRADPVAELCRVYQFDPYNNEWKEQ